MPIDLFSQINNAVLDLQGSQLQNYERPLRTLVRLLHDPSLEEINRSLNRLLKYPTRMRGTLLEKFDFSFSSLAS